VSIRPTFKRVLKAKSTEQFDGLPYLLSLLNCCICLWYGLPWVSGGGGRALVATVNGTGALFQLAYISLFIFYADSRTTRVCNSIALLAVLDFNQLSLAVSDTSKTGPCSPFPPQLKITGLLVLVVFAFALIAHASIALFDQPVRQLFVGSVSMASLVSMFASPLAVMVCCSKLYFLIDSTSPMPCV
jgi:solute carrier family 50 protein (sugar transporter)